MRTDSFSGTATSAMAASGRLAQARAALAAASAAPVVMAHDRLLPVLDPLAGILPRGGLVRGQVALCRGEAAWSLALALAAGSTRAGSWMMVVGLPSLGLQAAAEMGVALERTVVVTTPPSDQWAMVLAAALDGADVVLAPADASLPAAEARRVHARLRTRGGALVLIDSGEASVFAPDLVMSTSVVEWDGLGQGDGRLSRRRIAIDVGGRRARSHRHEDGGLLYLPDADGSVSSAALHLAEVR